MPLKCLYADDQPVLSYELSREDFETLRLEHEMRQHLHFACCEARVGLRVSKGGIQHFYHLGGHGACRSEGETEAHLQLKFAAMTAARNAGWAAECEVAGGDGLERWQADVLATRGSVRIAMEAQLSNLSWGEISRRQERYRAAGIRGLWFVGQDSYQVCREVPAFQVRCDPEGHWQVRISPPHDRYNVCLRPYPGHWEPLEKFISAAFSKNLVWSPALDLNRVDVVIRALPYARCSCSNRLLLPTSLAVSLPYPGHRSLLWTIKPYPKNQANPGPAWLNALVHIINRGYPEKSGALLATRHTLGRALNHYTCPVCGAEIDDVASRQGEVPIFRSDLPVRGLLPDEQRNTAEWQFLHQWWLRMEPDAVPQSTKQMNLGF
ncbi:hypothetical protein M0D69_30325 [Caballeronia sp. SEWSISQ10-4 2]|uniref:competence protein CoiA family protein n=1 Tax=Caballeronia sp. SEWSISQ10-4 2 TaxID=2937438 RepID=UPI00264F94C3|nr:competence protein CoiA family protein [Caballeronia sp. SEWSISQ10-4 2]MDN7182238.1 hypothetical protein [Caballeronia sp. SEWSISQ10-4 2]